MSEIRLPVPPLAVFPQTVKWQQTNGTDEYDRPQQTERTLEHVMFQNEAIYTGTSNGRELVANAVIFVIPQYTNGSELLNNDCLGDIIVFEGREYTIKKLVTNLVPFGNKVYSYEIEVL